MVQVFTQDPQYVGLDFDAFMVNVLNAHEDVEALLKKICDGTSKEWLAFHTKSLEEHTGTIQIRQRDKTWQLNRVTSIRDTAGYDNYIYILYDSTIEEIDYQNLSYRKFFRTWDEWKTVRIGKPY